mgnify:CR=1 FL=1
MKLMENFIYSSITFLVLYVVISVGLRLFDATSVYTSHLVGGIVATVVGMGMFILILVKNGNKEL